MSAMKRLRITSSSSYVVQPARSDNVVRIKIGNSAEPEVGYEVLQESSNITSEQPRSLNGPKPYKRKPHCYETVDEAMEDEIETDEAGDPGYATISNGKKLVRETRSGSEPATETTSRTRLASEDSVTSVNSASPKVSPWVRKKRTAGEIVSSSLNFSHSSIAFIDDETDSDPTRPGKRAHQGSEPPSMSGDDTKMVKSDAGHHQEGMSRNEHIYQEVDLPSSYAFNWDHETRL